MIAILYSLRNIYVKRKNKSLTLQLQANNDINKNHNVDLFLAAVKWCEVKTQELLPQNHCQGKKWPILIFCDRCWRSSSNFLCSSHKICSINSSFVVPLRLTSEFYIFYVACSIKHKTFVFWSMGSVRDLQEKA